MLSGPQWLTVQQTFYSGFAIVGGITEILGLISTAFLAYLLREQRTVFILTLAATLSFAGMLALFAFGNNPFNQQVMSWTPATIPANWREIRNAWDSFHAASSALAALALILLLITTLQDMISPALPRVGRISVLFAHSRLRRSPHNPFARRSRAHTRGKRWRH
ncbi:MAG TPA: hypothetical protein VKV19_04980 [Ktedonobacteraceae bacterium]|nr:hypothetical protein [Ktedonobacteraceae bacterium]